MLVVGTVGAALPSGPDPPTGVGRKRVIFAAIGFAAVGLLMLAAAPEPPIWALPGAFILGIGSGAYLAVDWALMTEVIPLAASGRYMGLANIANSISGPVGLIFRRGVDGNLMTRAGHYPEGPRVAILVGVVGLGLAAILLRGVHPRRDPRAGVAGTPAAS